MFQNMKQNDTFSRFLFHGPRGRISVWNCEYVSKNETKVIIKHGKNVQNAHKIYVQNGEWNGEILTFLCTPFTMSVYQ